MQFASSRALGGALSTSFSYACAFAAVKTYVDIRSRLGLHGAFWIYSGISVAGLFFACCLVPETKGVGLEEMEEHESENDKVARQQRESRKPLQLDLKIGNKPKRIVSRPPVQANVTSFQSVQQEFSPLPCQRNSTNPYRYSSNFDFSFAQNHDDDYELRAVVRDPLEFYGNQNEFYNWVTDPRLIGCGPGRGAFV